MTHKFRRWAGPSIAVALTLGAWGTWTAYRAFACPFCTAASQTLSQELEAADAAVLAELVEPMAADLGDEAAGDGGGLVDALPGEGVPLDPARPVTVAPPTASTARFRIVEKLRGAERLGDAEEIEVVYFGEDTGKLFLISAIADQRLEWTTPLPLSPRAVDYVKQLGNLPQDSVDRLKFFQAYFEDEDPLLAQDAYDEFARTPYADVIALGPEMPREKLLAWIESPQVGPSSRRLYLTMLGVCGQPQDVELLERMLLFDYQQLKPGVAAAISTAAVGGMPYGLGLWDDVLQGEERRKKESLDALLACYLILRGPEGLELVNNHYLGNPEVEYKYLHSAIMALRFHGEETTVLPREQLLASMRLALDHREFADQVIPDLTRWEDWSVLPRLVDMFKSSPEDDWIRQPVASYLLVAADQDGDVGATAGAALAELERLDPDTIKRARSLAAFSFLPRANPSAGSAAPPASTPDAGSAAPAAPAAQASTASPAADIPQIADASATAEPPVASVGEAAVEAPSAAADAPTATRPPVETAVTAADVSPAVDMERDAAVTAPSASGAVAPAEAPAAAGVAAESKPATPVPAPTPRAPSVLTLVGIPLLAGMILVAIFAVLLRGADPRSADKT